MFFLIIKLNSQDNFLIIKLNYQDIFFGKSLIILESVFIKSGIYFQIFTVNTDSSLHFPQFTAITLPKVCGMLIIESALTTLK